MVKAKALPGSGSGTSPDLGQAHPAYFQPLLRTLQGTEAWGLGAPHRPPQPRPTVRTLRDQALESRVSTVDVLGVTFAPIRPLPGVAQLFRLPLTPPPEARITPEETPSSTREFWKILCAWSQLSHSFHKLGSSVPISPTLLRITWYNSQENTLHNVKYYMNPSSVLFFF